MSCASVFTLQQDSHKTPTGSKHFWFFETESKKVALPAHGTNCGSVWPMATLALLCRYRRTASLAEAVVLTATARAHLCF